MIHPPTLHVLLKPHLLLLWLGLFSNLLDQPMALHKLICGSPGSELAGLVITKDPHLDPNGFKCQITCQTGQYCGLPVCTGHHLVFTHVHCTIWCKTYLLYITLGTEHNCNIHQIPFFPHCTMYDMLDCEKYQGGTSRTTQMRTLW